MKKQQQACLPIILRGHTEEISSLRFNKSNNNNNNNNELNLFSGDIKGNLNIFSLETRRIKHTLQNYHEQSILCILNNNGCNENLLYTQGREGIIKCLDLNQLKEITNWKFQSIYSFCKFSFNSKNNLFFVPYDKEQVQVIDSRIKQNVDNEYQQLSSINLISPAINELNNLNLQNKAFGMVTHLKTFNETLWISYEGGLIVEYDIRKINKPLRIFDINNVMEPIICFEYFSLQNQLCVGTAGKNIPILQRSITSASFIEQEQELEQDKEENTKMEYCTDLYHTFELSKAGVNDLLSVKQEDISQYFKNNNSCGNDNNTDINNNSTKSGNSGHYFNRLLFSACWDGNIRVFDVKRKKKLAVYKYHNASVNCLDYTIVNNNTSNSTEAKEEILLAAGSKDCRISVWNVHFETKKREK
ncbi:hypothetical protein ABK040_007570 [Willaertia magna]